MENPNTVHPKNTYHRNRVTIDCSSPLLTDQSFKKQCDINNLMKQYAKTGTFPHTTQIQPRFVDNTQIPSLEDAFDITNNAIQAFNQLPPDLRKLMDNNPANLENFIADENNRDSLLKHGILVKTEIPKPQPTLNDVVDLLKESKKPTE